MSVRHLAALLLLIVMVGACGSPDTPTAPAPTPASTELVIYGWPEDHIITVLGAFSRDHNVQLRYEVYESQEEAIENIRAGQVYDLVIMETQLVPGLLADGLLAEIDDRDIPNFRNISANFRNLRHDPGNRYTVPYTWGTSGLLVRTDRAQQSSWRWADLWDPRFEGQVVLWDTTPRYVLGLTLLSLGYSANSEDRAELEEALARLVALKPHAIWLGGDTESATPTLMEGQGVIALGWAYDAVLARELSAPIQYVLPEEGALLWGDNFCIPASSPHKELAERLINYILQPTVTAEIVNVDHYPMPNDSARAFIDAAILKDPVIYPRNEELENAELLLPLSAEGQALYDDIWARFLAAGP